MRRTNVYIDGFNLYYGCLKGSPFKWLDPSKLCPRLLPKGHQVHEIKYYTARVSGLPQDPGAPTRQQIYLRALRTIPNLSIVYGHFLANVTTLRLAKPPRTGSKFARVIKAEEKGSDVNLASHLLLDVFQKNCDAALVVSNDSDLLEPIRIARKTFGVPVGLACPHKRPSHVLQKEADFLRHVRTGMLRASQFPATLTDAKGSFSKPPDW